MANQNASENKRQELETFDFEELERQLQEDLENEFSDLNFLEEQSIQLGNTDTLGQVILDTVWEQFTNQIALKAGEDFIKENNGLNLDLRSEAHIQTTENFANGKIASHNTEIDYQKRYDDWQSNFMKDENGNTITHKTRSGKEEATLVKGARDKYDADRPSGSVEKHTDMDHTIAAAEIIRDAEAAAHMTESEKVGFANSDANLNEMDSSLNRSKGDKSMSEWLDNPNSKGQKPKEIFDISDDDEAKLRKKDEEARAEYEKQKKEAEARSIEAGKKSQKAEAFRIGKDAARAVLMNLLAELIKKIVRQLIKWLKSAEKNLKSLITAIKDAIVEFIFNVKNNLISIADTAATVIATSILGPVVSSIKRAWMFIKQGWGSLKQSIEYIKNPENRNKPVGIMMFEIGKIVTAGFTAAGAIVLGEVIEKGLLTIPILGVEIPFLGSIANVLGIFMGALVSGIIGALALNLINRLIVEKQKKQLESDKIDKKNEIINTQGKIIEVGKARLQEEKQNVADSINERHSSSADIMKKSLENIFTNSSTMNEDEEVNHDAEFEDMNEQLDDLLGGTE